MSTLRSDATAIIETRLVHGVYRRATAVLLDAVARRGVPFSALAELRDFVVVTLHHHHESEDRHLWPTLTALAPQLEEELGDLTREHAALDAALEKLRATPVDDYDSRAALERAANTAHELLQQHLEHEEPILFPALRDFLPEQKWAEFSRHVIASAPAEGAHLMIGFLDEVGTPDEVDLVLGHLPEPAREILPALRAAARRTLDTCTKEQHDA